MLQYKPFGDAVTVVIAGELDHFAAPGHLTIILDRQEDNALLIVSDTGVGIPEDAIAHVFERFYRVDKARSRQSGGSGLGLAIVRNMVERNHGTIHAQSTPGSGSTFTVSFPIFDTEEEFV